ncbi:DUF697 domain-containing protein [Epibacterium sp. SM1979]|uniref:DUF697 domain-containing protein n=1 Tax=Tritonibacter litoralis TaxID=2662264 RepID=A0A843YIN6_9RHOB|nr:TIGR01620 family protein [Tritonibacter litoralis]MQQ09294.1 DUF697 domain-containing protein [Tritonibacter litoralis]
MTQKPVLFEIEEDSPEPEVDEAPPVPDPEGVALRQGNAVGDERSTTAAVASIVGRRPSRLGQLFWGLCAALLGALLSLWVWDVVTNLIMQVPLLGWAMTAGFGLLLALAALFVCREFLSLRRLRRVDHLRQTAEVSGQDLTAARAFAHELLAFYKGRPDLAWARQNLSERLPEVMDADAVHDLVEAELLTPLDQAALAEVETAARQVATVTAFVPLALADVIVALVAAVRMIRRIGEIYGGRSGGLAAWRLTRRVFAHLVATGAMAAGDDLLEPILGASILSKLSRRFGEGLVNGALSARVGLAAIDLCRPMPFSKARRPNTRQVIGQALKGLVGRST